MSGGGKAGVESERERPGWWSHLGDTLTGRACCQGCLWESAELKSEMKKEKRKKISIHIGEACIRRKYCL